MLLLIIIAIVGRDRLNAGVILTVLLFEIIAVNIAIALNGAASNPFSSLLLVPLILGMMLLPVHLGAVVLLISLLAQVLQLYSPLMSHHGSMMLEHARGMTLGFVITCFLISAVVLYFRYQLYTKSAAMQHLRERQLRDEQLLAIGTAAAQITHDAATPVQTIRLLLEEMQSAPTQADIQELESQFVRIESMLKDWRDVANDVRESRISVFTNQQILTGCKHMLLLARPEANIVWPQNQHESLGNIKADRTLIPAITNIIINAIDANSVASNPSILLYQTLSLECWVLSVKNAARQDITFPHSTVGNKLVTSENGFGVGAVISNATIEKFNGAVTWSRQQDYIVTEIRLPLSEAIA